MNPTRRATCQQHIQQLADKCDSYRFFDLLTSDGLLDRVESLLPNHRERLYPPTETLSMFLAQAMSADRSCQSVVNQVAIKRLSYGLSANSTHTGGYCRARQRLSLEMVSDLTRYVGDRIAGQSLESWQWQGRPIKLVDGTTVTMPDTVENQAAFPQQKGQKEGLGFPICRMVGITCLSTGALQNAAVGRFSGKGGNEQTLLRSIQDTFNEGDVVMGDAFFATYFFIAAMQLKGVDLLMEQHGSRQKVTDFKKGKSLGTKDHLIDLNKPKIKPYWMSDAEYQVAPSSITVRELRVGGKTLITTLCDPKVAHKNELKILYKKRWSIELDLRDIKDTLGMSVLTCKTPEMAVKEIWIYLLAYNLIRLMMAQAALLAGITPREISFKHSLQMWVHWNQQSGEFNDRVLHQLCLLIAQQRVGNRPNRIEPRAVKRRPKAYPLLTKPRQESREIVARNGHPKKLK